MSEKMTVTFYRKELTWFGYEVEVDAETNEEAIEKIKDFDYVPIRKTDEDTESAQEEYGFFYFPDGTEIDDRESDNA